MTTRSLFLCLCAILFAAQAGQAATWYVATNGNDGAAGTSWGTAKRTIQAGVDLAAAGDTVLVSNGLYAAGGRVSPLDSLSNRVVITNNILVKSVNGPDATSIRGASDGAYTLTGCVRCVFITNGTLSGFTLTNGSASAYGGGIYLQGGKASNCVIVSCSAFVRGGGAYGGTLYNCILKGNLTPDYGGGSANGTLYNCSLSNNRVTGSGGYGGGAVACTLHGCTLANNTVWGSWSGGGGSYYCTLDNCLVINNSAGWAGGGSYDDTLNNCTLSGNIATGSSDAGGAYGSTLNNCIVWSNTSLIGVVNYDESCLIRSSCTTPMPTNGAGNIAADPQFADAASLNFHLKLTSPCIDVGSNSYVGSTVDLDGDARIARGIVDMGAYEIQGPITFYAATNGDNSAHGNSWATAKQTIQAAVDAAIAGDTVLVSNGVYSVGVRVTPGYSASNRVVITNNIFVQSANGPAVTVIRGLNGGADSSIPANIRCVFITNGVLSGFTLANGGAPNGPSPDYDQSGGGVYAQGGTLSNCVITGCTAYRNGGGSAYGALHGCVLSSNSAHWGGGSYEGTINSCLLMGNSAINSGGSEGGTLNNCLLWKNSASSACGGSHGGSLNNCIVWSNSAPVFSNYLSSTFNYSCTTPLPGGAGNIANDPQFIDAAEGNFHLSTVSPCIDAGSNSFVESATDLEGQPRIARGIVDVGIYEYQGSLAFCVDTHGNDSFDGHSWPTAKRTLQAAVDAAVDGDTVLASNGVYDTGVRVTPGYATSNRVVITKSIVVQSVNGPAVTTIQGLNDGTNLSVSANIRCVFITNGTLSGFTLAQGAAPNSGSSDYNQSGGGAFAKGGTLSNCVMSGCAAFGAGGGVRYGTLVNCVMSGNAAVTGGDGAKDATLYNCTVWGNHAGVRDCTVYNCIVYSNTAAGFPNYLNSTLNYSCTTPLPAGGTGNFTNAPQFVDAAASNFHLSATSPCIDAGSNAYVQGATDQDGLPRIVHGVVDVGAYEVQMVSVSVLVNDGGTTTGSGTYIPGSNFVISSTATNGHWHFTQWDDGYPDPSRTILVPLINVTYTALFTQEVGAITFYVATNGDDNANGRSWLLARRTIQAGVNLAIDGDTVLAGDGIHDSGSRVTPGGLLSNRVVITADLLLKSVHGAALTSIRGLNDGGGSFTGNMRCIYMTRGTVEGFTLTNGGTRNGGAILSAYGGGAYATGGTLTHCLITDCRAQVGGGAYGGSLEGCVISHNAAGAGGGVYQSTLSDCLVKNNTANGGGGLGIHCTAYNCTIAGNTANSYGGGEDYGCSNYNCIIYSNTAPLAPNWGYYPVDPVIFENTCTTPFPSNGTGHVTENPQFVNAAAGDYRLMPSSPCIDAGDNSHVRGTVDVQEHPRLVNDTVDIGAYERVRVWHVATDGDDQAAGTNWVTAKQTIQAALDAAYPYETVLVTNGLYAGGLRPTPGYSTLNRVVITNGVAVQSVNGPAVTGIQGLNGGAGTSLTANVRCVFITRGLLAGFTLTDGAAPSGGTSEFDRCGGGAFAEGGALSNCAIVGCAAYDGGGVFGGALAHCTLSDNDALWHGGGSSDSLLYNCLLTDNQTLRYGGGSYNATLYNCLLTGNSAQLGGGAQQCTLDNCTLSENQAVIGGGSFYCNHYNCILYFNEALMETNYDELSCTLDHCCASPLPSEGEGNVDVDPQFAHAAGGDFHLKASSPCINAGDNASAQGPVDLDGRSRIIQAIIDLGAYEYPLSGGYWSWTAAITNGLTNLTDCCTGDGYPNLLKYATGSCPTNSDDLADMCCAWWNGSCALNFNRSTNADDVTLVVEGAEALADGATWQAIATNINGAGWNSALVTESGSDTPVYVSVNGSDPSATNRFLRLRVLKP